MPLKDIIYRHCESLSLIDRYGISEFDSLAPCLDMESPNACLFIEMNHEKETIPLFRSKALFEEFYWRVSLWDSNMIKLSADFNFLLKEDVKTELIIFDAGLLKIKKFFVCIDYVHKTSGAVFGQASYPIEFDAPVIKHSSYARLVERRAAARSEALALAKDQKDISTPVAKTKIVYASDLLDGSNESKTSGGVSSAASSSAGGSSRSLFKRKIKINKTASAGTIGASNRMAETADDEPDLEANVSDNEDDDIIQLDDPTSYHILRTNDVSEIVLEMAYTNCVTKAKASSDILSKIPRCHVNLGLYLSNTHPTNWKLNCDFNMLPTVQPHLSNLFFEDIFAKKIASCDKVFNGSRPDDESIGSSSVSNVGNSLSLNFLSDNHFFNLHNLRNQYESNTNDDIQNLNQLRDKSISMAFNKSKRYFLTVKKLDLLPELVECHSKDYIMITVRAIDDSTKTLSRQVVSLGGLTNYEGVWQTWTEIETASVDNKSAVRFNDKYYISVILISETANPALSRQHFATVPICNGVMSPTCLEIDDSSYEEDKIVHGISKTNFNNSSSSLGEGERENERTRFLRRCNKYESTNYKVPLFVSTLLFDNNNPDNRVDEGIQADDITRGVGSVTLELRIVDEKNGDMSPMLISPPPIIGSDLKPGFGSKKVSGNKISAENLLLESILSPQPLSDATVASVHAAIDSESAVSKLYRDYPIHFQPKGLNCFSALESIAILSNLTARRLAMFQNELIASINNNSNNIPLVFMQQLNNRSKEIHHKLHASMMKFYPPFSFVDNFVVSKSILMQEFWGYSVGNITSSTKFDILETERAKECISLITRKLLEFFSKEINHTSIVCFAEKALTSGIVPMLWIFFDEWLSSPQAIHVIEVATDMFQSVFNRPRDVEDEESYRNKEFYDFISKNTLTSNDWAHIRCSCFCLLVMGIIEIDYGNNGYSHSNDASGGSGIFSGSVGSSTSSIGVGSMNSSSRGDSSQPKLMVKDVALDLLNTLLLYTKKILEYSAMRVKDLLHYEKSAVKNKDNEKSFWIFKTAFFDIVVDFLNDLLCNICEIVSLYVYFVDAISSEVAGRWYAIFDEYLNICQIFLNEIELLYNDAEYLGKKYRLKQTLVRSISRLVIVFTNFIRSQRNGLDDFKQITPKLFTRRNYSQFGAFSTSQQKQNPDTNITGKTLCKTLNLIGNFTKVNHRHFIAHMFPNPQSGDSREMVKQNRCLRQFIEESEYFTQSMASLVHAFYVGFERRLSVYSIDGPEHGAGANPDTPKKTDAPPSSPRRKPPAPGSKSFKKVAGLVKDNAMLRDGISGFDTIYYSGQLIHILNSLLLLVEGFMSINFSKLRMIQANSNKSKKSGADGEKNNDFDSNSATSRNVCCEDERNFMKVDNSFRNRSMYQVLVNKVVKDETNLNVMYEMNVSKDMLCYACGSSKTDKEKETVPPPSPTDTSKLAPNVWLNSNHYYLNRVTWSSLIAIISCKFRLINSIVNGRETNGDAIAKVFAIYANHSNEQSNNNDFAQYFMATLTHMSKSISLFWQMVTIIITASNNDIFNIKKKFTTGSQIDREILKQFEMDSNLLTAVSSVVFEQINCRENRNNSYFTVQDVKAFSDWRKAVLFGSSAETDKASKSEKDKLRDAKDNHFMFKSLTCDNYIGNSLFLTLYGSIYSCSDEINDSYCPINQFLYNRSDIIMSLTSFVKSASLLQLLSFEHYSEDYIFVVRHFYDFNKVLTDLVVGVVSSLRDLCDCDPLLGTRPDIALLCLEYCDPKLLADGVKSQLDYSSYYNYRYYNTLNGDSTSVEVIIRALFDVTCYLPKRAKTRVHADLSEEEVRKKFPPVVPTVNNRRAYQEEASDSMNMEKMAKLAGRTPFDIQKGLSYDEIEVLIENFYVMVEDCRRDLLVGLVQIVQVLAEKTEIEDGRPLADAERAYYEKHNYNLLESCMLHLLDRAVLCSIPSESIVNNCPLIAALFGNEYRYKNYILTSNSSQSSKMIYQRGSGAALNTFFEIISDKEVLRIHKNIKGKRFYFFVEFRDQLIVKYNALRLYVCSKMYHALRFVALDNGFHSIHEYVRSMKRKPGTEYSDFVKSSLGQRTDIFRTNHADLHKNQKSFGDGSTGNLEGLFEKKYVNILASRMDNLITSAAIHTIMKLIPRDEINNPSSSSRNSNNCIVLSHLLQELSDITKIRVNTTGKNDIRLYIEYDAESAKALEYPDLKKESAVVGKPAAKPSLFDAVSAATRISNATKEGIITANRVNYLNVNHYFLGILDEDHQCIGYNYMRLPRKYNRTFGVFSDYIEEMGNHCVSSQTILKLLLNEYMNETISRDFHMGMISLLLEDDSDKPSIDPHAGKSSSQKEHDKKAKEQETAESESESEKITRMLEHQHQLSRSAILNLMECGDWETSLRLINQLVDDLLAKQKVINDKVEIDKIKLVDSTPARFPVLPKDIQTLTPQEKFIIYRADTLVTELRTLKETVMQRLQDDGNSRSFPLYYAIRLLNSPYDENNVSMSSINEFLDLQDFMAATNLDFMGISSSGAGSCMGNIDGKYHRNRRYANEDALDPGEDDFYSLSFRCLGKGTWILMRYDPNAFISSAKMYKRFAESERKCREKGVFGETSNDGDNTYASFGNNDDKGRMDLPLPPPSYHAVLNKLFETFPQFRVIDSSSHVEDFFPNNNSTSNYGSNNNIPILQLFEAFPEDVCNEYAAWESLKVFEEQQIKEEEARNGTSTSTRASVPVGGSEDAGGAAGGGEGDGEGSEGDEKFESGVDSHFHEKFWEKSFRAQSFYVFAFEDETMDQFKRNKLSERELVSRSSVRPYSNADFDDAGGSDYSQDDDEEDEEDEEEKDDDGSECRVIRYTLTMSLPPTKTAERARDDRRDTFHKNNDIIADDILAYLDTTANCTLPWLSTSCIGILESAKRISVTDALIQITHYQSIIIAHSLTALERMLSFSATELAGLPIDDMISPDTIIVAALSSLANMIVTPNSSCVGLHNIENLVCTDVDRLDQLKQKQRKEMKRASMRQSTLAGEEPNTDHLNFDDLDSYYDVKQAKLDLLLRRGRILLAQVDEILYGMREFVYFKYKPKNAAITKQTVQFSAKKKKLKSVDNLRSHGFGGPSMSSSAKGGVEADADSTAPSEDNEEDENYETLIMWKMLILWLESSSASLEIGFTL